jgi:hypothetical protein
VITDYRWMLGLVGFHGVFWSGLLSASAAYMTNMLPERRRAEGIGYWGLATVAAIAVRRRSGSGFIATAGGGCALLSALNMLMG